MKRSFAIMLCTLAIILSSLAGTIIFTSTHITPARAASGSLYDPGSGKTLLMIGQTYTQDYADYTGATGRAPAGGSVYGNIYSGQLDSDSQALVASIAQHYPSSYVEVGLSIKDGVPAYYTNQYGYAAVYHVELDIANHVFDRQIDAFAQYLKNWPQLKFLLRIDYEVSLNIHANTNPAALDPASFQPQAYQNAFNYVANRIRNTDATSNIAFIYHPVRSPNDARALYPGSQYVDWFGVSVFNNDVCLDDNGTDNCAGQQLDPNLANVLQFGQSTGKPLMISESAVQAPASQATSGFEIYLGRVFSMISTYDIRAFTYINYSWPAHGWSGGFANSDSRVQEIPAVLSYWEQMVASGRYLQYGAGGGPPPPPTPGQTPTPNGNSIPVPGNIMTNIGAVASGQTLSYTINAASGGAYYVRVTASSSQASRLLSFSLDGQPLGSSAFGPGSSTFGPPDFNLSAGRHTLAITSNSSGVSISSIDIYKRSL